MRLLSNYLVLRVAAWNLAPSSSLAAVCGIM